MPAPAPAAPLSTPARTLIADLARFTRWRGAHALALAIGVAVLESLALVLLVPILALSIGAAAGSGLATRLLQSAFASLHLTEPRAQLVFLLLIFATLFVGRLAFSTRRDVLLTEINIGFVDSR